MQLPAIREKILGLPRLLKVLLPILFILILIIVAEGFYYLWTLRKTAEESKYINTEVVYQEGVFLYDKETKEPIAIRGWVTKIDGWFLTIENNRQEVTIEINKDFEYADITREPKSTSDDKVGLNLSKNEERSITKSKEIIDKELREKGIIIDSHRLQVDNLNLLINIGDFVVVNKINLGETGIITGEFLSLLSFLRK
ncbi:MAG TPA: hypothetical protein VMY36_04455 [Patescibacteria group bacterium]|nr:hypothetical protein [Patescibacteria group bacterium]